MSLVYFTSPGCGACRHLRALFENHAETFSRFNLFEVDAQQDMALTREFEVFHLPSLFLFKNGEFHAQIHSEPLPQSLMAAVETALAAEPQEAP